MHEFDKIIGYENVKRDLERTADILRNANVYKDAGAKIPAGMLLHGRPGVGKSLMAESLIEASGLPVFTVRKDKANGTFIDFIREAFIEAIEAAPAIVYLDDMDKFANNDMQHRNAEEFVTVQACIDEVRGKDVFVLATTNDLVCLPDSLTRAGRFDKRIQVRVPEGTDAENIIEHYLAGKPLGDDIAMHDIVMLMSGNSCAQLESILNEARLISIAERSDTIGRKHFMEAFLGQKVHAPMGAGGGDYSVHLKSEECRMIAVHEAGHAAIYGILLDEPSTSLATAFKKMDNCGGTTFCYRPPSVSLHDWSEARILGGLGGKAATDLVFGTCDEGAGDDLRRVSQMIADRLIELGLCGLDKLESSLHKSSSRHTAQDSAVATELERYYQKAKQILAANREFLDKLADAIENSDYLLGSDIQAIKATCTITRVNV